MGDDRSEGRVEIKSAEERKIRTGTDRQLEYEAKRTKCERREKHT